MLMVHFIFVRRFRSMWLCGILGFAALAFGSIVKGAVPVDPPQEQPKKEKPKNARPNDLPFPIFPDLQPGLDDDEFKQLQMEMEKIREELQKNLDQLRRMQPGQFPDLPGFQPGGPMMPAFPPIDRRVRAIPKANRLGAAVDAPSPALIDQLDLPKNQGIVIGKLKEDSAAANAGLKEHDILLELDGKAVPSKVEEFVKVLNEIKSDAPVDATVLRKGKRETIKGIKLPKVNDAKLGASPLTEVPKGPFTINIPPNGGAFIGNPHPEVNKMGDGFTASVSPGIMTVSVSGKLKDGKAQVEGISIDDGQNTKKYLNVKDVPEEGQVWVQLLILLVEKPSAPVEGEKQPPKGGPSGLHRIGGGPG
jgi:hypothetical protein